MSKIFITGIAGFLGSHLADAMLADGHEVTGIDNLLGGYRDNVPKGATWFLTDCNNFEHVKRDMAGADIVYHTAATAYEGLSVFSPSVVNHHIMGAATTVFSAAIANKVKRIVHCSSMARYGSINTPYTEDMTPRPQDPYGISKLAAEHMLKNLCETHGMDYVIAVPHNIIGPRQKYDDPFRNVASIMINLMLQGKAPIIYGDGSQQRCFSYIDDCLYCLKEMAFSSMANGQTINIGPDEHPVTIQKLFREIADIVGYKGRPIYMPGRPQEVKVALCSSNKARRLLGYETKTPLRSGLVKMVDWIGSRGTREFSYHLPLEIVNERTPKTWTQKLF